MAELLPCPFCGTPNPDYPENCDGAHYLGVFCKKESCQGHAVTASAWNTRNDEAARQTGAEDAILKSGIMQLKIDSAVSIARQEEREACAKICEKMEEDYGNPWDATGDLCAEAIRKRGEK